MKRLSERKKLFRINKCGDRSMAYTILYHPEVLSKDLLKVPVNIKTRIKAAIESRLARDPVSYGGPLRQSLKGHRKLRVGDFRIIFRIDGDNVIILKIGHRKEVYGKVLWRIG